MTSRRDDWQRVQTVFAAALERAPADRATWLDDACAGDPFVREEVDALLHSHDRAGRFLALDEAPESSAAAADALAGLRVGSFALVREIGRGGMSVVYLAERVDGGFTQEVAVKILDAPSPHRRGPPAIPGGAADSRAVRAPEHRLVPRRGRDRRRTGRTW